ncbi:MAG TPA: hypothetical protein DD624_07325 [Alphaproteobacteria bacterium]|nr:hypothetical protein [Alphaproteobacteria bacterium]
MDNDIFSVLITPIICAVLGIFAGCVMTCESSDNRVVNRLCQRQQYDFCEVSGYKMKGELK